jgi:hypothetical protein
VLLVVLLLYGPVTRHWKRLVKSLVPGLVAATIVTVWADKAQHAALTAHGASAASTLATIFGLITIVVTAALITIGARRAKKRGQSQRRAAEISRPAYRGFAQRYQNEES